MLDHLPTPEPDVERLKAVLRCGRPDRVPLFELAMADEVLAEVNGRPLAPLPASQTVEALHDWARDRVNIWHRLGYDYYRVRAEIPFVRQLHAAADTAGDADRHWSEEGTGVVRTREDFERYAWPERKDIGFEQSEATIACLPPGMQAIGFSGGVLEWASAIMGLQGIMFALHDDPDLVRDVVDRVGQTIFDAFKVFCSVPEIFAIWLGDDMGFKTSTLIAPDHLRQYVLPWHRRYAELAHKSGRFFLLHSCGNLESIMPDLIDNVGIDARHSFEDVIVPVEQFHARWGAASDGKQASRRIAVLGGVDVDLLSRGTHGRIVQRTQQILEACAPAGGYACGSGNSIANYVPAASYLTMVETLHRFNGRL